MFRFQVPIAVQQNSKPAQNALSHNVLVKRYCTYPQVYDNDLVDWKCIILIIVISDSFLNKFQGVVIGFGNIKIFLKLWPNLFLISQKKDKRKRWWSLHADGYFQEKKIEEEKLWLYSNWKPLNWFIWDRKREHKVRCKGEVDPILQQIISETAHWLLTTNWSRSLDGISLKSSGLP